MNKETYSKRKNSKRRNHSRTRRIFFLLTTFWGYFLGIATLIIILKHSQLKIDMGLFFWLAILISIIATVVGAFVFHSAYREYRKKKTKL